MWNREKPHLPILSEIKISSLTPLRVMCPPSKVSLPRPPAWSCPYLHTALISKFPLNLNCILFKFFPMWIKSEKGRCDMFGRKEQKHVPLLHVLTYLHVHVYIYLCVHVCAYIHHVYLHTHIIYIYTFDYKSWDAVWLLIMWYSR